MLRALPFVLVLALIGPIVGELGAQQVDDEVYGVVAELDHAVFEAFNTRDRDAFLAYFASDLEFFHDVDGFTGYPEFVESSKRLFGLESPLRRELVEGSLEVHEVPGYGAIQIGQHEFCHWEGGVYDCGVFGFTHLWRQTADGWMITRVYSYGHE